MFFDLDSFYHTRLRVQFIIWPVGQIRPSRGTRSGRKERHELTDPHFRTVSQFARPIIFFAPLVVRNKLSVSRRFSHFTNS